MCVCVEGKKPIGTEADAQRSKQDNEKKEFCAWLLIRKMEREKSHVGEKKMFVGYSKMAIEV